MVEYYNFKVISENKIYSISKHLKDFCLIAWFFFLLSPTRSSADFDLPILFPVQKVLVVDERVNESVLEKLSKVDHLSLEVRMSEGNMMRDILLKILNDKFRGVVKKIVLSGRVKSVHAEELGKLEKLEVLWRSEGKKMDNETFSSLFELGPVRKYIEIPGNTKISNLSPLKRMKFYTPVILLGNQALTDELLNWLEHSTHRRTCFVLSSDFPPEKIYDLCKLGSICLEILTVNNSIPTKLMNILKDLRGVDLEFVVDGRLTLENVSKMATLDRFSLKIDLGHPPRYTPGLVRMLNRIAPPSMIRALP